MDYVSLKTAMKAAFVAGAFCMAMPAMADVQTVIEVVPSENIQGALQDFTITFTEASEAVWNVTGTENAPVLMRGDVRHNTFGPTGISAEGNTLSLHAVEPIVKEGEYTLVLAAGSYTVDGEAGQGIELNYVVANGGQYVSIEPSENIVAELQNFRLTFGGDIVSISQDAGTLNSPVVYLVNEDGTKERRGTAMPQVYGNVMDLSIGIEPLTEMGDYELYIPGTFYFVDGVAGRDLSFNYTVVEATVPYPEVELSVEPSVNWLQTLDEVTVTFGGVENVYWTVNENTSKAPYLEKNGQRFATFTHLSENANVLSLALGYDFNVHGEYALVIPAGSYAFGGEYNGMAGEEIRLYYAIEGLTGITVEPAASIVPEIQNVRITFNEFDNVVILDDQLGTLNSPTLYIVNPDGIEERRSAMMPTAAGNNMFLTMNSPIQEEGEYVIRIPGTTYTVDGNPGGDLVISYQIVAPSYPAYDLSVEPSASIVSAIDRIVLTFEGDAIENVSWLQDMGTPTAPYVEGLVDGVKYAHFSQMDYNGNNQLVMGLLSPLTRDGEYKVVIPEGSYFVNGFAGHEVVMTYTVVGNSGLEIEPSTNIVPEVWNVRLTFNGADEVSLAEGSAPAVLQRLEDDGTRSQVAEFNAQAHTNNIFLSLDEPVSEEGEYVVLIPAGFYTVSGVASEEPIEIIYQVIPATVKPFEVTAEPADNSILDKVSAVELTFPNAETAYWNYSVLDTATAPWLEYEGTRVGTYTALNQDGNKLTMDFTYGAYEDQGEYTVYVQPGTYMLDGEVMDEEIVLHYNIQNVGISAIFGNASTVTVYDFSGRVVVKDADAQTVRGLKGMFIINGKKHILR